MLDELDRRIVGCLQVDARAPWGRVAAVCGRSESTVARRAQRMFDSGELAVLAIVDTLRCDLGIPLHLHVRCAAGQSAAVAKRLSDRPDTRFVATVTGEADVVSELVTRDRDSMHTLLVEDLPSIPGIAEIRTQVVLRNFLTVAEWQAGLLDPDEMQALRADRPSPVDAGCSRDPVELTPDEHRLIELLRFDGRAGYRQLADRLGVSESTVSRRMESLRRRGVIRLRAEIEPRKLGFDTEALIWLKVRASGLERVGRALSATAPVRYVSATAGTYDAVVEVALPHNDDLYTFITETIGAQDDIVNNDVTVLTRALKRGWLRKSADATIEREAATDGTQQACAEPPGGHRATARPTPASSDGC